MNNINNKQISNITTRNIITSYPDMIMTEVSEIFETNSFHHLPVLDEEDKCVGIISKSDYHQLQDKFTRLNNKEAEKFNTKFFKTLLASDVMTENPVCLALTATVKDAISIFLDNKVHCIVVNDIDKCIGIITPYDILKLVKSSSNV